MHAFDPGEDLEIFRYNNPEPDSIDALASEFRNARYELLPFT